MKILNLNCDNCKGETTIIENQLLHYTDCGLGNVYLENLPVRICKQCQAKSYLFPRSLRIHQLIGLAIALSDTPLNGEEIKYLRNFLGYRVKDWAKILKVKDATVVRWEAGTQMMSPQSEAFMRLAFIELLKEKDPTFQFDEPIMKCLAAIKEGQKPYIYIKVDDPLGYRYVQAA